MKDSKTKETGYGKCALMKDDFSSSETQVFDNIKLSVRPVVCDYGIYENDCFTIKTFDNEIVKQIQLD